MNVHDNVIYAAINKDVIVNIFICEDETKAQDVSKEYGEQCFAVNCSNYKVCLSDIYKDGKFYNGETGIEIKDTSFDAQMREKNEQMEMLTKAILDLSNYVSILMQKEEE